MPQDEDLNRRRAEYERRRWNGPHVGLVVFALTVAPAVYWPDYWWATGHAFFNAVTYVVAFAWIFICAHFGDIIAARYNRMIRAKFVPDDN